ncbi:hypothetical protein IE81DRAFT_369343 [Ceraceosorus guamensis]|uniref:G-patch domain-containing protein n=1 Tax=Ceraceosorus guamensis TaxID=1522189 RepID=A0A316VRU0_9BASI|nr:hypothetical protein IE81DRAFT_369343 [Ceraceosorus guamensis]PWN39123.1 hypothetical protein IE81DRAFT_369343 [Ceraceosorus guamensis]
MSFVRLGTPLSLKPSSSSSGTASSSSTAYKPAWEQEVLDEQGRRRFHGAFTGGYSAGYFNTVGSKEGWVPSSFISRRRSHRRDDNDAEHDDDDDDDGAAAAAGSAAAGSDKRRRLNAQSRGAAAAAAAAAAGANGRAGAGAVQRVEDFMDEEDRQSMSLGVAALQTQRRDAYRYDPLLGALGGPVSTPSHAPSHQTGMAEQADPISVRTFSKGQELLERMGWKRGTGLGPRISLSRYLELLRLSSSPSSAASKDAAAADAVALLSKGEEESIKKHGALPPDMPLVTPESQRGGASVDRMDRKVGLGYDDGRAGGAGAGAGGGAGVAGPSRARDMQEALRLARQEQAQSGIRGAFGVGALEDEEGDEGEAYASGMDLLRQRVDFEKWEAGLRGAKSANGELAMREGLKRGDESRAERADQSNKQESRRGKLGEDERDERRWQDGRVLPKGFLVGDKLGGEEEEWYAPPEVPPGWTPDPQSVWGAEKEKDGPQGSASASALQARDRAKMLGEAPMPGPPPSILNYLSAKDRERLEASKATAQGRNATANAGAPSAVKVDVPRTEQGVALAALKGGYQPFPEDLQKQQRYERYLQAQAGVDVEGESAHGDTIASTCLAAHAGHAEQANQELREFQKSANIFRPMSSAMSSRFIGSSSSSSLSGPSAQRSVDAAQAGDVQPLRPGLYQPTPKSASERAKKDARLPAPSADSGSGSQSDTADSGSSTLTPAQQAAKKRMFGALTRRTRKWKVERLLCKRLGVPAPGHVEEDEEEEEAEDVAVKKHAKTTDSGSTWHAHKASIEALARARAWESSAGASAGSSDASKRGDSGAAAEEQKEAKDDDLNTVGVGEDQRQMKELDFVRPALDIFKAVFASDESDEEEEEEEEERKGARDKLLVDARSSSGSKAAASGRDEEEMARGESLAEHSDGPLAPTSSSIAGDIAKTTIRASLSSAPGKVLFRRPPPAAEGQKEEKKTKRKERGGKKERAKGMLLTFDLDEE